MSAVKNPRVLFVVCRFPGPIADDEFARLIEFSGLEATDFDVVSLVDLDAPDPTTEMALEDYDAVIISGSPLGYHTPDAEKSAAHRQLEARGKALMNRLVAEDRPTLAICFGLQTVALSLGGSLTGEFPEDLQAPAIHLTAEGLADPLASQLPEHFRSFTGHSDAVADLPRGAVVLAKGDFCPIQMVRLGRNVYGTQFHPEITPEGMRIRVNQYGNQYYPADQKEAVLARCLSADVSGSNLLITRFVERYVTNRSDRH